MFPRRSPAGSAAPAPLTFNSKRANVIEVVAVQVRIHAEKPAEEPSNSLPEILCEGLSCTNGTRVERKGQQFSVGSSLRAYPSRSGISPHCRVTLAPSSSTRRRTPGRAASLPSCTERHPPIDIRTYVSGLQWLAVSFPSALPDGTLTLARQT